MTGCSGLLHKQIFISNIVYAVSKPSPYGQCRCNFRGIQSLIRNGNFCCIHVKPGLTGKLWPSANCLYQHYRTAQTFRSISVGSILHKHIVEWLVASMRQAVYTHLQDPSITHLTSMVPAIDHTTIVIPEWVECESGWSIFIPQAFG